MRITVTARIAYIKLNFFVIDSWNDDMWEEYCSTADGETIEAGDAWMELPKPPEHKLNENR